MFFQRFNTYFWFSEPVFEPPLPKSNYFPAMSSFSISLVHCIVGKQCTSAAAPIYTMLAMLHSIINAAFWAAYTRISLQWHVLGVLMSWMGQVHCSLVQFCDESVSCFMVYWHLTRLLLWQAEFYQNNDSLLKHYNFVAQLLTVRFSCNTYLTS